MYNIKLPERINQIISVFHFLGLWQGNDKTIFRKKISRILNVVVYAYYPISLAAGSYFSDNETEQLFLGNLSIAQFVLTAKLYFFLLKNEQIIEFIRKLGAHSTKDSGLFNKVNNKIRVFVKFGTLLASMLLYVIIALTITSLPIFSKEKKLPVNLYFPVNWKENELFYWMAFAFVDYLFITSVVIALMNMIIWYIMMSCAIKYEIMCNEFRNIGFVNTTTTAAKEQIVSRQKIQQNLFCAELISLIKYHQDLYE